MDTDAVVSNLASVRYAARSAAIRGPFFARIVGERVWVAKNASEKGSVMKRSFCVGCAVLWSVALAPPVVAQSCPGDIDGDNQVTVDELLQSVNRALLGCLAPIVLGGPFDGEAFVARTGCADPVEDEVFVLDDVTVTFTVQEGSRFSGRLDGVDDEGEDISLLIGGSVDADGVIRGTVEDDEGEVSGTIHGGIAGRGLSLTLLAFEPEPACSIAGNVLALRRP